MLSQHERAPLMLQVLLLLLLLLSLRVMGIEFACVRMAQMIVIVGVIAIVIVVGKG